MGCVTSKHLKEQADDDGWSPSSPRTRRTPLVKSSATGISVMSGSSMKTPTSSYSVKCYHHEHFISLTSTSYGSLNVEPQNRVDARSPSLSDMYGKLRTLEKIEKSPISVHDGNKFGSVVAGLSSRAMLLSDLDSRHRCFSAVESALLTSSEGVSTVNDLNIPRLPATPSFSTGLAPRQDIIVAPETINVNEMMMGLEDAAPSSRALPPSKCLLRPKVNQQQGHQLKRKADELPAATHIRTSKKGTSAAATSCREWSDYEGKLGKENTSPPCRYIVPSKIGAYSFARRDIASLSQTSKAGNPMQEVSNRTSVAQLSQQSTAHRSLSTQACKKDSTARKEAFDTKSSLSYSLNDKCSPGVSSASVASTRSVQYAPPKAKVMPSLGHSDGSSEAVHTPPRPPARSLPRKLALGERHPSADSDTPAIDPELVASYEKALSDASQIGWDVVRRNSSAHRQISSSATVTEHASRPWQWCSSMSMPGAALDKRIYDPLVYFQQKCPPGGENAVVLYTTTLRGIRKTFEDCNTAREALQSFSLKIDERDVSMHLDFLNELRELMGRVVSVPRMFIKGRYIGGIEEVVKLHEDGKLSELVEGLPKEVNGGSCDGCGGIRFVPCLECRGSRKLRSEEDDRILMRCPECNENGLIQCPICT
ncbi:hypothetical protein KP509_06G046800 [Ceratopteris richardii]|uniref:Glutaredoxin domain-containing protein n=1 Tax=Ceratopteris richardii TaxID=49495 RepID=A0A8T2UHU2_CERRI|nr:hypothetical protein KP509_06G046800 [Ceratopteris richardii]KAH7435052.1 hypothetical protein KP509_06G046800 [Ceratopteris richardii]KAH7435053.1 hypothetical protein KP509_06G046800 [Ceratopteris richardii]KAH7435054.1 hypothetical protein KP509_06G046800 [Ceratopteris richardii]